QLPDIILGQKQLQEKMEQQGQGSPKNGKNGEQGKQGEQGKGNPGEEGKPKPGKNGKGGNGENGTGSEYGKGPNEAELEEIYDIYKEQQELREQLEQQLQNLIDRDKRKLGEKLIRQMEDFQNELLENGITKETMDQMKNINYELIKLENAAMEQGEKEERKSTTAIDRFQNPILTVPEVFRNNRSEVEILNRQALPLQQNFKNKVKEYFKNDD